MIRKHQRFFNIMQITLDALSLLMAYAGAIIAKHMSGNFTGYGNKYLISSLWMIAILLIVYYFMGVYSPMRSRLYRKEVIIVIRAHLVGVVIIFSLLFLNKHLEYSREVSLLYAMGGILLVLLERYIVRRTLRYFRKNGFNQKHLLIIGVGPVGMDFACKVQLHRDFGYNIVGYLDDDEEKHGLSILDRPVLGCIAVLPSLLENQSVDEVVVALPLDAYYKYSGIIDECEKAGVRIRIIPDYYNLFPGTPKIEEFDGIPLLNARMIPLDDPFNRFIKRVVDILLSIIGILLTGFIMLFIAVVIKLTSPGPVFFRQKRVGLNNRRFDMLKFRTMRVADDNSSETFWTTVDDPRKTKFGSFLRRTSLDELPQFFNVLSGSMSIIGPRPERPYFVDQFKDIFPKYMVKHQVKPGITGWAQVNGWRGDTSIEKRVECDIYYIENWDLLLDIKIIFLTIFKGLINDNAY